MKAHVHLVSALSALLFAVAAAAQSGVQRCEGSDGRVTYSNTQCPAGTKPVRKVNTDPPVSLEERRAAEDRAKKDNAAVKQVDKAQAQQEAGDKRQADERAKAEAKNTERCERARRDLERARDTRAELSRRVATAENMQKADAEIGRREAALAKDCAR